MAALHELYDQADKLKADGKHEEAIAIHEQILEQDADYALSHHALGVLFGFVNQHDKAVEHGEKACELEPNDPFSYTALSVIYVRAYQGTGDQKFIQMAEDAKARSHTMSGQPPM